MDPETAGARKKRDPVLGTQDSGPGARRVGSSDIGGFEEPQRGAGGHGISD